MRGDTLTFIRPELIIAAAISVTATFFVVELGVAGLLLIWAAAAVAVLIPHILRRRGMVSDTRTRDHSERKSAYRELAFGDNSSWLPWEAKPRNPQNNAYWKWWNNLHAIAEDLDNDDERELLSLLELESQGVRRERQQEFRDRYNSLRRRARKKATQSR